MVTFGLYLTYFLFFVALVAAIGLPIVKSLDNPKTLLKPGIGIAAVLVLFLLAFGLSGSDAYRGVEGTSSKLIGGAIISMYFMMFLLIVAVIYTEFNKIIK